MVINEKLTTGSMKDYIVETGTDGIWTYRKWNSGVLELWTTSPQAYTFSSVEPSGSVYISASTYYTYPAGLLVTEPQAICQKTGGVGGWLEVGGGSSASRTPSLYAVFEKNRTQSTTVYISIYAIGKWK